MNVYHAKLSTGEDLIGYYDGIASDGHVFKEPMVIEERINPNTGNSVMVLNQYSPYGMKEEILLPLAHVMFVTPVSEEYANYYKISKAYNKKYVYPAQMKELHKVIDAMEDVLFSKDNKESKLTRISSSLKSNTSFH